MIALFSILSKQVSCKQHMQFEPKINRLFSNSFQHLLFKNYSSIIDRSLFVNTFFSSFRFRLRRITKRYPAMNLPVYGKSDGENFIFDFVSNDRFFRICDPILKNRRCTQNSTFVINRNIKIMGKIQKSYNKIMQVINCHDSQWVNTLINKSWVSLCLPAHWEFENVRFVLVFRLVLELWLFVHATVTKEFMDDLFSVNMSSLSDMEIYIYMDCQLYLGGWRNFWQIKWVKFQLCTPLH